MSLRVWLPLNGGLNNQGLEQTIAINNGAIINEEGKIGKCYQFNGSTSFIDTNYNIPNFALDKTYSVAFWIYSTNTSGIKPIIGIGPDWGWTIFQQDNDIRFIQWDEGGNRWGNPYVSNTIEINTWVHIVLIWKKGRLFFYKNGQEIGNWMAPTDRTIKVASDTIKIGGNIYAWGTNYFSGRLNDVRIYDHALSPLEVKEISKGLILHYPLNRGGWGQENFIMNTGTMPVNSSTIKGFRASGGTVSHKDYNNLPVGSSVIRVTNTGTSAATIGMAQDSLSGFITGEKYTESCWVRASTTLKMYLQPLWISTSQTTGVSSKAVSSGGLGSDFSIGTEWTYIKWEGAVLAGDQNATYSSAYIYARSVPANGWFEVCGMKVEHGDKATPWCPNSSDALATTMGLNDNIEYDTSGYGNNGTRTGTFSWTSNTPKYTVSQVFNGTDNTIQTPSLPSMISDKNYTIAVWIYKTVIGSKSYQTIYGGPSGFEIEARNGGANETKIVPWNWGKPMASYELNEWNHCVFVHSDSDCKIYLNGEYVATGTAKASNPSGNYFVGAWNTATQQNFEGLMSDFRIYATALSADDVKSLYQNSAYIDNQGNIYGAVYEEV